MKFNQANRLFLAALAAGSFRYSSANPCPPVNANCPPLQDGDDQHVMQCRGCFYSGECAAQGAGFSLEDDCQTVLLQLAPTEPCQGKLRRGSKCVQTSSVKSCKGKHRRGKHCDGTSSVSKDEDSSSKDSSSKDSSSKDSSSEDSSSEASEDYSSMPSATPSTTPSKAPSIFPSTSPSEESSSMPSSTPSTSPSKAPSSAPSASPSDDVSSMPSAAPSTTPSKAPSNAPSTSPSDDASSMPSWTPSTTPSKAPSNSPSASPSDDASSMPSATPSTTPSKAPSISPSISPSDDASSMPSSNPSTSPSQAPSNAPSASPSEESSSMPSATPSTTPSKAPSNSPIISPSDYVSSMPSASPSTSPSKAPSNAPSASPSDHPSSLPSATPSTSPSKSPSNSPSFGPSVDPSSHPSAIPSSVSPSDVPSSIPSISPSTSPSTMAPHSPSSLPSVSWDQVAKLTADDAAESDLFGLSVAISGETVIIGAHFDDDKGSNSGSAYIFEKLDGSWNQTAKLTAVDGAEWEEFGVSVAISGETAIIGAVGDDVRKGSAYIFEKDADDGTWNQTTKLAAEDGAALDRFGQSVAISGDTSIVGAYGDDDKAGSAYIFEKVDDGSWKQTSKLTAQDGAAGDFFGHAVAISNQTAIIGAIHDDDKGTSSGSTYIFEKGGDGSWYQVAKLNANDGAADDSFGWSVAISGGTVIIGANNDDNLSGSAYIFENLDGSWNQTAKLTADDGAEWEEFGVSVAISGETAIIGAVGDDVRKGSAYIFEKAGDSWRQVTKLTADDGVGYDNFGVSVTISGNMALIGAFADDDNGSSSGSAYIFENPK